MFNVYGAHSALSRIRKIRNEELPAVRRDYFAAADQPIPDAHHLTAEGLDTRRKEQRAAARARADARMDQLEAEFTLALDTVRAYARGALAPSDDPTSALLTEQRQGRAWERSRRLLEAGHSVTSVIKGAADADTVHALRAELPAWISAQNGPVSPLGGTAPDFSPLMRSLDEKLVEHVSGDARTLLRARLEADSLDPGARESFKAMRSTVEQHRGSLGGALAVRMADQLAGLTVDAIEGPDDAA
ncbi:hypothetical protein [Nocardiopsis sp. NRRL B-16309]|uniref:hypothetical protein n=1 Tax=Nocardiopsis sp. NRRL B-16309 TaxID=1519494 RepID=UPI0006AF24A7|nr:hypothetical protein [Nocardiopsis sp. NRRL B-16309]KOX10235.1 hypothetical protein ADL05_26610 [Nocardiopsis sp. NRRL B-16309]